MLRKLTILGISIILTFLSTPSFAGEDWGWYNGRMHHPKYYVMNVENEGLFIDGCWGSDEIGSFKLQVKLGGKKSKWTTVANSTPIRGRFDHPSMIKYNWYWECDEPNPISHVWNWNPPDWQKDYPARYLKGKKVIWSGSIVIHPNLKKIKPYTSS